MVGSTRYMHASLENKRTEIGSTFVAKSFQRTPINTATKILMLGHAFDTLKLHRVEFLVDFLNQVSRRAVLRLGAREEGVLRAHRVMAGGRVRDSVVYSIVHHEWPGVKQMLGSKLVFWGQILLQKRNKKLVGGQSGIATIPFSLNLQIIFS